MAKFVPNIQYCTQDLVNVVCWCFLCVLCQSPRTEFHMHFLSFTSPFILEERVLLDVKLHLIDLLVGIQRCKCFHVCEG